MLTVLAVAALIVGVFAAACSGGVSEEQQDARAREIAVVSAAAQRAQLIAALEPLNPLRYHQLDRMIRDDGRVPTDALVWSERARQTLQLGVLAGPTCATTWRCTPSGSTRCSAR